MVNEILSQQEKIKKSVKKELYVANNLVGLVIGKGGETIRGIN